MKLSPIQNQYVMDLVESEKAVQESQFMIQAHMSNKKRQELVSKKHANEKEVYAVNKKWQDAGLTFPDADSKKKLEALALTAKVILSDIAAFDQQILPEQQMIADEKANQAIFVKALMSPVSLGEKPMTEDEINQAKAFVRDLEEVTASPAASPSSSPRGILTALSLVFGKNKSKSEATLSQTPTNTGNTTRNSLPLSSKF